MQDPKRILIRKHGQRPEKDLIQDKLEELLRASQEGQELVQQNTATVNRLCGKLNKLLDVLIGSHAPARAEDSTATRGRNETRSEEDAEHTRRRSALRETDRESVPQPLANSTAQHSSLENRPERSPRDDSGVQVGPLQTTQPPPRANQARASTSARRQICYTCGDEGHLADSCPQVQVVQGDESGEGRCRCLDTDNGTTIRILWRTIGTRVSLGHTGLSRQSGLEVQEGWRLRK